MNHVTKIRSAFVAASVMGALVLFGLGVQPQDAQALAGPLPSIDEFNVSCTTSATRIVPASGDFSGGYTSLYCQNENADPVTLGATGVIKTVGPRICNAAACIKAEWSGDVQNLYCVADSTTTVLKCLAGR